jgi:hypothetical protein
MCNNSTPAPGGLAGGLGGYLLTTGYDLATGLGSVNVIGLLNAATTPVQGQAPVSIFNLQQSWLDQRLSDHTVLLFPRSRNRGADHRNGTVLLEWRRDRILRSRQLTGRSHLRSPRLFRNRRVHDQRRLSSPACMTPSHMSTPDEAAHPQVMNQMNQTNRPPSKQAKKPPTNASPQ